MASVPELVGPPHREAVALAEEFGDFGVEFARRDVERAVVELRFDGPADRGVHVAGEQRAEAHVVVDVLVAVDVDHVRLPDACFTTIGCGS